MDDVCIEPSARALSQIGGTIVVGLIAALTLTSIGHATAAPVASDLQAALAAKSPPDLKWKGSIGITIGVVAGSESRQVSGQCHAGRPVVVQGGSVAASVDCAGGRYTVRMRSDSGDALVATQVLLDGNIVAARHDNARTAPAAQRVAPAQLGRALASARPGDRLVVEPGTYADAAINLTNGGGATGRPVIIDGNNAVTFMGATQIRVGAGHVVLRGFMFRDVGVGAITIAAPSVRITGSIFENCGDPKKPQAECVIARPGGESAELDFNTFVGSRSMTIKIRAGGDGDRQPTGAFIHHNVFRDIARLSNNGQEPIQIAGPNGGGTNAELRARIEHNLFYRAEGDREAVSIKTPGTTLRWNVFRDMDAAPNIRGSRNATVSDNLLIRTRPIRINGSDHRVEGNVVLCPAAGVGFVVSHGSPGYETTVNTLIRDNVVATKRVGVVFGAQTQPVEAMAPGTKLVSNTFYLPKSRPIYEIRPADTERTINKDNSLTGDRRGPDLCS